MALGIVKYFYDRPDGSGDNKKISWFAVNLFTVCCRGPQNVPKLSFLGLAEHLIY